MTATETGTIRLPAAPQQDAETADGLSRRPPLVSRFYPEHRIGGFTRVSASMEFLVRVAALLRAEYRVLDYGAGRGAYIDNDTNPFGRSLKILRGRVAHVEGCDVDPVVMDNPYLDHAEIIPESGELPYADGSFDMIVSTWVFEHVPNPEIVSRELLRVLKPGGYICAITPNRFGYLALASSIAQSKNHVRFLRRIQPGRLDFDVFPTCYRLNSRSDLKKHFGENEIIVMGTSSEPAYHFDNPLLYRIFKLLHRLTPDRLHTAILIFIRKL
jgi:SAM-dependent methyltransferase